MTHYPLCYSFNEGTWFVYDPPSDKAGDGAFAPNRAMRPGDIADGLSNTLAAAEVKAYQPNQNRQLEFLVPFRDRLPLNRSAADAKIRHRPRRERQCPAGVFFLPGLESGR